MEKYEYLGGHLDNKNDWRRSCLDVHKKEQSGLYFNFNLPSLVVNVEKLFHSVFSSAWDKTYLFLLMSAFEICSIIFMMREE